MEMYPTKGGAPHFSETGIPVYPQVVASTPEYNQAFPPQAQPQPVVSIPPYNQAFPPQSQAGVSASYQAFPGQNYGASTNQIEWSTGLCGCCEDPTNCCMTFWCPCIMVGWIAEVLDGGATSCALGGFIHTGLLCASAFVGIPLTCLYSYGFRTKLRSLYSLKKGCTGDCYLHCRCKPCAICQEYRGLKLRGADPALGWQGNVYKWNRHMLPSIPTGMYR